MCCENLLFLPGFLCDRRLFLPQIRALEQAGINCSTPRWPPCDDIGDLAEAILADAPERFALAGLSMGGLVALEITKRAPGRVARLALLDTTYKADAAGETRRRQLQRVADGEFEQVMLDELKPLYMAPRNRTRERLELVMDMARMLGPEAFERQTRILMSRPSYEQVLPGIDCPSLVLCGRMDMVCPLPLHRKMAADIPRARLAVVEECGHLSTLERPEDVTRELLSLMRSEATPAD